MRRTIQIAFLLVAIIFLGACSEAERETYRVQRGHFVQTITETGELAAVNEKTFLMPRYGRYWYELKIIGLLDHGTMVAPNDSIIQFDPSEIKKFIIDRETQLETHKANLEKTIVEISNRKSDLQSNLRSEQAAFDLKKLEVEQFRFESDKTKKIKELEFKQAQIRLEKVKRSVELYDIISDYQLKIQKINVNRREKEIENAYNILPDLTIRTPIKGIFQIAKKRRSREFLKIGDEVNMNNKLGSVPDLSWMKVNTVVNEADFMKIYLGQEVNVRLDALPDVIFEGEVSFISKLCHPIEWNSRQKVFDVEVTLKVSDERLKPGMTVSCEYICNEFDDVFYAPLNCVESLDNKHYVYLENGNRKEVKTGPANNTYMVLEGNIAEGEKLLPLSLISEN